MIRKIIPVILIAPLFLVGCKSKTSEEKTVKEIKETKESTVVPEQKKVEEVKTVETHRENDSPKQVTEETKKVETSERKL